MAQRYGILAFPAGYSLSPDIHNAAFKALNIDAEYDVFDVPEDRFKDFMKCLKIDPVSGLSVSLPYKENVLNYMHVLDEDSEKIGAVNTVVNRNGVFHGYNTDFIGSNRALEEAEGDLKGKNVVILGAGGASRAIIYGLLKAGANVVGILNRNKERADALAEEFSKMFKVNIGSDSLDDLAKRKPFSKKLEKGNSILIQTTSIWTIMPDMGEEEVNEFCPKEYVQVFSTVMDIVYNPKMTPLLKIAKNLKKKIVSGDRMFLHQAFEQFKLWTGQEPPVAVMEKALKSKLE